MKSGDQRIRRATPRSTQRTRNQAQFCYANPYVRSPDGGHNGGFSGARPLPHSIRVPLVNSWGQIVGEVTLEHAQTHGCENHLTALVQEYAHWGLPYSGDIQMQAEHFYRAHKPGTPWGNNQPMVSYKHGETKAATFPPLTTPRTCLKHLWSTQVPYGNPYGYHTACASGATSRAGFKS